MASILAASNYWTATAFSVMFNQDQYQDQDHEEEGFAKYTHDDCGVKCFVTADEPNNFTPLEPHCANCGYPPHICDVFYTRCAAYKPGRWFSEEKNEWIDPKPVALVAALTPEQEEEARWNQHKYGLCPICKTGLDDKADFTFNYSSGAENGIMMCFDCDAKLN